MIAPATIADLRAHAAALRDEVVVSDLGDDVKVYVLKLIQGVDQAMRDSKITGIEGVERALDQVHGGLLRRKSVLARVMGNQTGLAFVALLTAVNVAINSAQGVKALMPADDPQPPQPTVVVEFLQQVGSVYAPMPSPPQIPGPADVPSELPR